MPEDDLRTVHRPGSGQEPHQDFLAAENVSLRLLLAQAEINTRTLLAKAGIDAREREASDKLQKLILEELHHRIKNTVLHEAPSQRATMKEDLRYPAAQPYSATARLSIE